MGREAKKLSKSARGDIKSKHLNKTGGLVFSYLYDRPLIDYLGPDEAPQYLRKYRENDVLMSRSYSEPLSKIGKSREKNLFPNDPDGSAFTLVTDQRVLFISGYKDGDRVVELPYEYISAVKSPEMPGRIFATDVDGNEYRFQVDSEEAVDYVKQSVAAHEYEEIPSGRFYSAARVSKTGQQSPLFDDGEYKLQITEEAISLSDGSDSVELRYENLSNVRSFRNVSNKLGDGRKSDIIAVTYSDAEEGPRHHLFFSTNPSLNQWFLRTTPESRTYIPFNDLVSLLESEVGSQAGPSTEVEILKEWFELAGGISVEEWSGEQFTSGTIEGSVETRGKSKGLEVGPFSRGKSKSEGEIEASISQSTTSNTYSGDLKSFQILSDGVVIGGDITISVTYEEVERVFSKEGSGMFSSKGIVIQTNHVTYELTMSNLSEESMYRVIDDLNSNLQADSEGLSGDTDDTPSKLRELKQLFDDGILTENEYNKKKEELLEKL